MSGLPCNRTQSAPARCTSNIVHPLALLFSSTTSSTTYALRAWALRGPLRGVAFAASDQRLRTRTVCCPPRNVSRHSSSFSTKARWRVRATIASTNLNSPSVIGSNIFGYESKTPSRRACRNAMLVVALRIFYTTFVQQGTAFALRRGRYVVNGS